MTGRIDFFLILLNSNGRFLKCHTVIKHLLSFGIFVIFLFFTILKRTCGGIILWYMIPLSKKIQLIITQMKTVWFILTVFIGLYLFSGCNNTTSPELGLAAIKEGRSRGISSHAPGGSNADRLKYIQPGETAILFDVKGTGVINHIWLTFNEARPNWLEKEGSANPAELVIRMYWDDSAEPAVESPVGDFFAAGFGLRREVKSAPVLVEGGDGYNCYWQMPFRKAAKITVTNESKKAARSFYFQFDYTEYKNGDGKNASL